MNDFYVLLEEMGATNIIKPENDWDGISFEFNGRLCEIVADGGVIESNISTVDVDINLSLDDILSFAIKEPSSLKKLLG